MESFLRKITTNTLAKSSAIVFAGSMIANVGAYLYHLIVGRILGPSGYGELSSLISLLYLFGVPTIVLMTVLVKYFSICKANKSVGQARYLYIKTTKILLYILLVACILLSLLSPVIASFLHLSGGRVLLLVYAMLVFSTLTAVSASAMQGFQLFGWVAVFSASVIIGKLLISIPFAYRGVEMTVLASVISTLVFYILYFFPIRFLFWVKEKQITMDRKKIVRYSIPTFFTILGMTSLYSFDIVLAKHYLSSYDAGIYSAVAVLGKVIFYASSAIVTVLFPVLSERFAKQEKIGMIVTFALFLVFLVSFAVTAIYALFPLFVTHLLFGPSYDSASSYLGIFGIFISLYAIANIFIYACLAVEKMKIWVLSCLGAISQIMLISFFHSSLSEIIYINIIVGAILFIASALYYRYGKN